MPGNKDNNANNATKNSELLTKAVESALEWSKQIITLSTGTLVISGTFIRNVFSGVIASKAWIFWSWALLSVSILTGILYLGTLCKMLNDGKSENLDIYSWPSRFFALIHVLSFFSGMVLFVIFIYMNFK